MSVKWAVTMAVDGTYLGQYWWDGELQSTLLKRAATPGVVALLEQHLADLRAGREECRPNPLPSNPVPFDAADPNHMVWALTQLHGREIAGGKLEATVDTVGPRKVELVAAGQMVY